jgi:hypothetical protein
VTVFPSKIAATSSPVKRAVRKISAKCSKLCKPCITKKSEVASEEERGRVLSYASIWMHLTVLHFRVSHLEPDVVPNNMRGCAITLETDRSLSAMVIILGPRLTNAFQMENHGALIDDSCGYWRSLDKD